MITTIPYQSLGHVNHGWLDARHHFSFGSYHDPERMGFGKLRVINDDIIAAGTGFATHPHDNMEIITYVRKGAITHKDSKGNEGRTEAGDVQVMSAGTGIFHSEYNRESEDTTLYQIWIEPNKRGVEPRWDAHEFPKDSEGLTLLVDGEGEAPLHINADAKIYAGRLAANERISQKVSKAYLLISDGEIEIEGQKLSKGDAAEIDRQDSIDIQSKIGAELILIDLI